MNKKKILIETYTIAEKLDFSTIPYIVKQDVDVLIDKVKNAKYINPSIY